MIWQEIYKTSYDQELDTIVEDLVKFPNHHLAKSILVLFQVHSNETKTTQATAALQYILLYIYLALTLDGMLKLWVDL